MLYHELMARVYRGMISGVPWDLLCLRHGASMVRSTARVWGSEIHGERVHRSVWRHLVRLEVA